MPVYDFRSNRPEIDFAISNLFFAPWTSAVEYTQIEQRDLLFQTAYPLVVRASPGMTSLDAGCAVDFGDGFSKAQIEPFVYTAYSYPYTGFSTLLVLPLERKSFYSDKDRTGAYAFFSVRQYLPSSELRVGGVFMEDPQKTDTVFPTLRGYSWALGGWEGVAVSVDYSIPLLKNPLGPLEPKPIF